MNVKIDENNNEFLGETSKYCIEGNYIWFYDEISGALYRLDRESYIVKVILTPMEIHQKKILSVRQILKRKNKIYIIPNNISFEWLIYDIVDKSLERIILSSKSYVIGNAVSIGDWIYLIPEKTNHVLVIVEAEKLNIKTIIADWYKNNVEELACWGNTVFENKILFPIIGTKEIFQIQGEQIIELSFHIKKPIYSISLCANGIWILPSEGNEIFRADENGELIDSFEIQINGYGDTAEQFARIITVEGYVYLFPKQGGQIWVWNINSKEWIVIGEEDESLYRSLYQKTRSVPYWGYYCLYNGVKTLALRRNL